MLRLSALFRRSFVAIRHDALGERGTMVTQHDKSRRQERLVKALRDNLRRRKAALREPVKTAGENESVSKSAVNIESDRAS